MPWQASLATEQVPPEAIRAEIELLRESGQISADSIQIAAVGLIGKVYERRGFASGWGASGKVDLERRDAAWVESSGYNAVLQTAVSRFQARHGLEVDALVGRATLRALNVSVEQRINQIRLNLESLDR